MYILAPKLPYCVLPPTVPGAFLCADVAIHMMKQDEPQSLFEEPEGIVISRGWEPETTPHFSAYMWAPGPEDDTELDAQPA